MAFKSYWIKFLFNKHLNLLINFLKLQISHFLSLSQVLMLFSSIFRVFVFVIIPFKISDRWSDHKSYTTHKNIKFDHEEKIIRLVFCLYSISYVKSSFGYRRGANKIEISFNAKASMFWHSHSTVLLVFFYGFVLVAQRKMKQKNNCKSHDWMSWMSKVTTFIRIYHVKTGKERKIIINNNQNIE